jgi:hypothetical protein
VVGEDREAVVSEKGLAKREDGPDAIVDGSVRENAPRVQGCPPGIPFYEELGEMEVGENVLVGAFVRQS